MDGGNGMIINGSTLTAESGKVLQKGNIYATIVHLGVNDSTDNWLEVDKPDEGISDSEALEIITEGS